MDFFEHQDRARRNTATLVTLFAIAVTAIAAGVYGAAILLYSLEATSRGRSFQLIAWQPQVFLAAVGSTLVLIVGASWQRIRALDDGGGGIALAMGARQVQRHGHNAEEQALLNIVEEMAIASGVRVPFVFVLDHEAGINAFAAGLTPADAAITVTRGCLTALSRDELQGVIAHEFSHILNGDMRLNLRLVGILHGILVLGQTGGWLMRASRLRMRRGFAPGLLVGFVLFVLGYVGLFFGKLIRAAVSRQREFLADASAVQFTRNPEGIAGALARIAAGGSLVAARQAEEMSHFFFSDPLAPSWFRRLLASHPPLAERIERIAPGTAGRVDSLVAQTTVALPAAMQLHEWSGCSASATGPAAAAAPSVAAADVVRQMAAAPGAEHLAWSRSALDLLPESLRLAVHDAFGAVGVTYALLLDGDPGVRERQLAGLQHLGHPALADEARRLQPALANLDARLRLPIIELAIPALRQLGPRQHDQFVACLQMLAEADARRSVFEYALERLLVRRLATTTRRGKSRAEPRDAAEFYRDCAMLLSSLAWAGGAAAPECGQAFAAGIARLSPRPGKPAPAGLALLAAAECSFAALDAGLERLAGVAAPVRARIVDACAHVVAADGAVALHEAELLRCMAEALGCPLPPILPRARGTAS